MSSLPNNLKKISLFLERLPGIGEKTANRLAFYFLRLPDEDLKDFAESISSLKTKTKFCKNCFNLTENNLCSICEDGKRDRSVITVVETVLDLLSFETGNIYNGIYHVLHGKIDPLNHVGPDDIRIKELLERIKELTGSPIRQAQGKRVNGLKEIILATNPDMEGEVTAMYIKEKIQNLKSPYRVNKIKITRLAYGLPIGANLEYADYMTLKKAIEGRNKF
ncbi:recombination protein RecR [Candidatus Roizmanbacteria bacterium CG_4_10_14_0_2_um_filter_36_35]|uniref:Recombination protein RecR n=4 Tax=Candidatus Roizmaniibacteriota TaxID=1752723 RepID=A0A2M7BWT7_9BACT|nr:MAG: recombination protein RecR [Candidatus Roizmanbacteria bacterium CG11_big_fil_rev_8_21_14_0_20_35_14]PIV11032.1 MAG: recombination protein RecR [Candidatus Roizmanbacteria bacterium CG03_land_8_20_14_0_80_35_26]PIZ66999.1 MAG: recombination protein RecR [Candidatus Roizmanbacteria bacterium CG_4_10_14_0_2_um_filter_36_35]PJC32730.1 MAG: recombination protein RecR [Candidatus Roizmanbacteria bacterium CG_4_9_14_0_2_um_filter_36_12]PJC80388.1 MAG: recombination protein RecR [Candidatus Ro